MTNKVHVTIHLGGFCQAAALLACSYYQPRKEASDSNLQEDTKTSLPLPAITLLPYTL